MWCPAATAWLKQSQDLEPSQDGWWITGAKRRERCQDVWTRERAVGRRRRWDMHVNHLRSRRPGSAGVCPTKDHWLWLWASLPETASITKRFSLWWMAARARYSTAEKWNPIIFWTWKILQRLCDSLSGNYIHIYYVNYTQNAAHM